LFQLLGMHLLMSTAAHPETDGLTGRVNLVLEDVLHSYATSFVSWSSFRPMVVFVLNNATHSSTGLTPYFVKNARHPRIPALLAVRCSTTSAVATLRGGGLASTVASVQKLSDHAPTEGYAFHSVAYDDLCVTDVATFATKEASTLIDSAAVSDFLLHRQVVTRFVRDALQAAVDKQQENTDRRGRKNEMFFRRGDRVLLSTDGIQGSAVTTLGANKLAPRFIGPFKILKVLCDAYTLGIPTAMRHHPTFYVGRLKPYVVP